MLSLPSAWTYETELPIEARIPGLWDTSVPVISGTHSGTSCFADRPEKQEHGSRSRARTTGRDFGDLEACLHRYTTDGAHRSVIYTGYVSTLAPMGKSIV